MRGRWTRYDRGPCPHASRLTFMDWKNLRDRSSPLVTTATASILVVEDDAGVRDLWCKALNAAEYRVKTAESAEAAIPLLLGRPHVAVVDVHLGGSSGLWLAEQIRSLSPTTAIVLATGD